MMRSVTPAASLAKRALAAAAGPAVPRAVASSEPKVLQDPSLVKHMAKRQRFATPAVAPYGQLLRSHAGYGRRFFATEVKPRTFFVKSETSADWVEVTVGDDVTVARLKKEAAQALKLPADVSLGTVTLQVADQDGKTERGPLDGRWKLSDLFKEKVLEDGASIVVKVAAAPAPAPGTSAGGAGSGTLTLWRHVGEEPVALTVNITSPERFDKLLGSARLLLMEQVEDGPPKPVRIINTLEEALEEQRRNSYLFFDEPTDKLTRQVQNATNSLKNQAMGLEQQTTKSIYCNEELQQEFGGLQLVNEGHAFTILKKGKPYTELDGVLKNTSCLVLNSVKMSASLEHVDALKISALKLQEVILAPADAGFTCRVFNKPVPALMQEIRTWRRGAKAMDIVPFISSFCFMPPVQAKCRLENIRMMRTDGTGYSP